MKQCFIGTNWRRNMQNLKSSLACLLLLAVSAPVIAVETTSSDQWRFGAQVYLWGASISGTTASGADIDVPFSAIIDNLDFGAMVLLGARKDKWSLIGDFIYLNLSDNDLKQGQGPVPTQLGVGLKGWIINMAGGYAVVDSEKTRLELIAGARYLWLKGTLKLNVGEQRLRPSDSGNIWDGIVGLRGQTQLNEKWYLTYEADVGTGGSDLSWEAVAGVGYQFKKVDVVGGYRYLTWDLKDDSQLDDLTFKGPYAGVRWTW
jgi:hypothetical protein